MRDEFLSEEDLDLRNLSEAELLAFWGVWLHQAQATNDLDAHQYAHGVFILTVPAFPSTDAGSGGISSAPVSEDPGA